MLQTLLKTSLDDLANSCMFCPHVVTYSLRVVLFDWIYIMLTIIYKIKHLLQNV